MDGSARVKVWDRVRGNPLDRVGELPTGLDKESRGERSSEDFWRIAGCVILKRHLAQRIFFKGCGTRVWKEGKERFQMYTSRRFA